ncbi:hypothetical protein ACIOV9_09465, partial [Pseudomonas iridis]|uniref:hypothetical protein n=1 Tax=Pseudomonas iridis TaxID=2710587 RepID=UPI0038159651
SVVKERLVKIFRLNRGAHSTAASFAVKWLFSEVFEEFFNNFNHLRFRSLVSGRRILQRYSLLSTPLFLRFRPRRSNRQKSQTSPLFQLLPGFDELKRLALETYLTH